MKELKNGGVVGRCVVQGAAARLAAYAWWLPLAATTIGGSAIAASRALERVVAEDRMFATTVGGTPARLRIEPDAPGIPILNAELARAAGLRAGALNPVFTIGSTRLSAESAVTRIDLGGGPRKRRVSWAARPYAEGADGTVGPVGLPEQVVRFQLSAPRAGERTVALPMDGVGGIFGPHGVAAAVVTVDGAPLRVRFVLRRAPTLATAGAGISLSRANGGRLEGEPSLTPIAFGVSRPVRRMRLAQPLEIGPLRIDTLFVRSSDYGNATGIAEAGVEPDPDEVVVTAKGKRNRSNDMLAIGRDDLGRCSSIIFDKRRKQVRLTCG
jgi:hypothetical protein